MATLQIIVPESWEDVTLRKYLALQRDLEAYKDDEDAQVDFMLYHLCGIESDMIRSLSHASYNGLKSDLTNLLAKQESELKRIVKVGEVEYGFEPNLSKMSYGAYVDISKYETIQIDDNWATIMSILYRPVDKVVGKDYSIETYTGNVNPELWLDVSMDVHFGALFFFVRLSTDLLNSTLNSTTLMQGISPNIKSILERSGKLIPQSLSLQEEIYKKLTK